MTSRGGYAKLNIRKAVNGGRPVCILRLANEKIGDEKAMRDFRRIDKICEELAKLWKLSPDLRLGQLLCNLAGDQMMFYVEDDIMLDLIEGNYKKACEGFSRIMDQRGDPADIDIIDEISLIGEKFDNEEQKLEYNRRHKTNIFWYNMLDLCEKGFADVPTHQRGVTLKDVPKRYDRSDNEPGSLIVFHRHDRDENSYLAFMVYSPDDAFFTGWGELSQQEGLLNLKTVHGESFSFTRGEEAD